MAELDPAASGSDCGELMARSLHLFMSVKRPEFQHRHVDTFESHAIEWRRLGTLQVPVVQRVTKAFIVNRR